MKVEHVWKPKESKEEVSQHKQKREKSKKENRDLRPATFIKDLHKRSKVVEEEKA